MAKRRSHRLRDFTIYILVLAIGFLVRQLPRKASLRLGAWIGDLVYHTVKRRRDIALNNLKMTMGDEKGNAELKQIARRSFQNMGKTLVEFLSTPKYDAKRLLNLVKIEGMEHIKQAMDAGMGIVAVSAHFGNWELIFQVMSALNYHPAVIVQPFKNHRLDELVNSFRIRYGGQIIKRAMAIKQALKLLRDGVPVAVMSDQNAGDTGVFVDFFGIPASTPRGPAMFALRTGATIINLLDIRQADDTHLIVVSEPVNLEIFGDLERDIEVNTARLVKMLEELIRKYPCQWLWMHNRWKTRPDCWILDSGCSILDASIQHPTSSIQKSVLILSDGKPGHYNQSLGIIDRMADISVKIIEVRFKRKWRDDLLRVSTRFLAGVKLPRGLIKAMLMWAMESASAEMALRTGYVDAILSTGSSVAAPNILLSKLIGAKTAVCTRPSPVGANHFDLAILPRHTRLRRSKRNVVMTLGVPNRITPEFVRTAGVHLAEKLDIAGHSVIGLLLGGEDPYHSIPPGMASLLCDVLLDISRECNTRLALTTSRRTDRKSERVIKSKMLGNPLCCFSALASEPQQESPVPGILGISRVVIVTEDSFSMVCEAASSGRKIIILKTERKRRGHPKRQRVYEMLTELGYTKSSDIPNLKSVVLGLLGDAANPKVLDDAQTAADALRKLIYRHET